MKTILNGVVGQAKPGQMVAIMGASGTGKTSLLNCLSQRNRRYQGRVCANGEPTSGRIAAVSGFVHQEDLFLPTLTVREHLTFHATLRLPRTMPAEEKRREVDKIVAALSLTKCVNTLIGGSNALIKGISGGEMKRLSFATEVLFNPSLLFCDEPTSGLDSFIAEEVVREMRRIADSGRTVIATIHQPSSQVFERFTHLVLLAGAGRVAYLGPRPRAVPYFAALGHPCPQYFNPADFFIHLLAILPSERDAGASADRVQGLVAQYQGSELDAANREWLGAVRVALGSKSSSAALDASGGGAGSGAAGGEGQAPWLSQFARLYQRTALMYKRDPLLTKARLGQSVVVSLLVGLIYLQLGSSQADVQNKMGAAFFIVINQCILGLFSVIQVFPLELPIFLREYTSGTYRVDAYFLSRTFCEVPIQFTFPILYGTIAWWLVDFRADAEAFVLFLLLLVVAVNSSISLGYAVSAAAANVATALAVGPMLLFPLLIFGGLLVNVGSIPAWLVWLEVFSFFKYAYTGMSILVWKDVELECPDTGVCPFENGDKVLEYLNMEGASFWTQVLILVALTVGFRLLAFLILLLRARRAASGR